MILRSRRWGKLVLSVLCLALAGTLFLYTVDREFIHLLPTLGVGQRTMLEEGKLYEQRFVAQRTTISRLGLFLQPLVELPHSLLTIELWRGEQELATTTITVDFLDKEGFTQVVFAEAVPTKRGEQLTLRLTVPPDLHQKVSIQHRLYDGSFNADDVVFLINGQAQPAPLAYQVFYRYRPTFGVQIGVLLVAVAAGLSVGRLKRFLLSPLGSALVAAGLFVLPALLQEQWPWLLTLAAVVAAWGMRLLLRQEGLDLPAQLLGAQVFALNTWFILHYSQGRVALLLVCVLPWLWYLSQRLKVATALAAGVAAVSIGLALNGVSLLYDLSTISGQVADIKNIFLDPYQVPPLFKLEGQPVTWDHFGSYVGSITLALAGLGLWRRSSSRNVFIALGLVAGAAALVPIVATSLATVLWLPPAYLIIFLTFTLAYLAAQGLQQLATYLGTTTATTVIVLAITVLSLLDMLFVAATSLEFIYL